MARRMSQKRSEEVPVPEIPDVAVKLKACLFVAAQPVAGTVLHRVYLRRPDLRNCIFLEQLPTENDRKNYLSGAFQLVCA